MYFTTYIQDLYTKNCKLLLREIKDGIEKLRYTIFMDSKTQLLDVNCAFNDL